MLLVGAIETGVEREVVIGREDGLVAGFMGLWALRGSVAWVSPGAKDAYRLDQSCQPADL